MRTEQLDQPCEGCGYRWVWRTTATDGRRWLECPSCLWGCRATGGRVMPAVAVLAVATTVPPVTVHTAQRGYATASVSGRAVAVATVTGPAAAAARVTG